MSEEDDASRYPFPRRGTVTSASSSAVISAKALVSSLVRDIRKTCTRDDGNSLPDEELHKWYVSETLFRQATETFERARRFKFLGKPLLAKMQEARCRRILDEIVYSVKAKLMCARFLSLALCFEEEDYWKARREAKNILESLDAESHENMEDPVIEVALSQASWRVGLEDDALSPLMDANLAFPNHSQILLALSEHWLAREEYSHARNMAHRALDRNDALACFSDLKKEGRALECLALSLSQLNIPLETDMAINNFILFQKLTVGDLRVRADALDKRIKRRRTKETELLTAAQRFTETFQAEVEALQDRTLSRRSADIPPDDGEAIHIPKISTIAKAPPRMRHLAIGGDRSPNNRPRPKVRATPGKYHSPPVLDENSQISHQWPPLVELDLDDHVYTHDVVSKSPDVFVPHVITFSRPNDDQIEGRLGADFDACDLMPSDHPNKIDVLRNPFEDDGQTNDGGILGFWCCNRDSLKYAGQSQSRKYR